MQLKTLTVTDINNYLKKTLDNDFILNNISVKGEVSNFKLHSSGHMYFSLKDEGSKINCIMFRDNAVNLDFMPEDGMKVEMKARLSVYIKEGTYQLYCRTMKKAGMGELFEEFQNLKKELQREGIFDEEAKQQLPFYPKRIGVITSPTGAAIRDVITVITRRNKALDVVLYPALVQGAGASDTIIDGIRYFNNKGSVDVIIVGRGGGSIEELWAFNDRELAYEIFNSRIPIVSAVGHEVDFTICDFVSDVRAATPSAAAELVSPNMNELKGELNYYNEYLNKYISSRLAMEKSNINYLDKLLSGKSPKNLIQQQFNNLKHLENKMSLSINHQIDREKNKIAGLNHVLMTLNPLNTLGRGYSVIKDTNDNVISDINTFKNQKEVKVIMQDGSVSVGIDIKK